MGNNLKLSLSPCVDTAYTVKVPCSFSPTGEHFISVFLKEATSFTGVRTIKRMNHVINVTSECRAMVPEDQLNGMLDLARLSGNRGDICALLEDRVYEILRSASWRKISPYDSPRNLKVLINDISKQTPALGLFVDGFVKELKDMHRHDPEPRFEFSYELRQAKRLENLINKHLFKNTPYNRIGYNIIYSPSRGFGLANEQDVVIAWRKQGRWYLMKDWIRFFTRRHWGKTICTKGIERYCPICDKRFDAGGHSNNQMVHDAWRSDQHQRAAVRKVKLIIHAFESLTNPHPLKDRIPRKVGHLPYVTLLPFEEYCEQFDNEERWSKK